MSRSPSQWYHFDYPPVIDHTGTTLPAQVGSYYPVCTTLLETYGELDHRIRMIYALSLSRFIATESQMDRRFTGKVIRNKAKQVGFSSCPQRKHLIQYGSTQSTKHLAHYRPQTTDARLAVRVLGYQVITTPAPEKTVTCLGGLTEARSELMSRTGSHELLGISIGGEISDCISSADLENPEAPWNQESFDTGVCNCLESAGMRFHRKSLLHIT